KKEVFALYHRKDRRAIGSLGLHNSWTDGRSGYEGLKIREMGYVLAKDYWGQGLMPEAGRAVIAYCFEQLGLDALTSGHFVNNRQSKRVIEKLGFKYVETDLFQSAALNKSFEIKRYIFFRDEYKRKN
ncbi:MAG: GNAT family N-acetyltransferase, partial [Firmicutes bacterium]|nr:GNAT family N-acetyltransferase [Bacillota bacterium]